MQQPTRNRRNRRWERKNSLDRTLHSVIDETGCEFEELLKVNGTGLVNVVFGQKILEALGIDLVADDVHEGAELSAGDATILVPVKGLKALLEVSNLVVHQRNSALKNKSRGRDDKGVKLDERRQAASNTKSGKHGARGRGELQGRVCYGFYLSQ